MNNELRDGKSGNTMSGTRNSSLISDNGSALSRYRALDFFARQVVEGFITGRHRSPFHGFSSEFSDYRQYNTGESTRNIDWHLYARTDKLFVKLFEEETNLRCQMIIDSSSSMLFPLEGHGQLEHPNKLTFSVYAAAVLIELLYRQRDAFGLSLLNDGLSLQTPCRSSATHRRYLFSELEHLLQPADPHTHSTTSIIQALHLTAEQLHRRSLVVLFTDAFLPDTEKEPFFEALRHLRHCKHEVILFHTFDRARELNLDYSAHPYRFIDLESGRTLRLNPQELSSQYSTLMNRAQAELARRAMQYRIDYQPIDVSLGFHQVLQPFLLRRSKMQ